MEFTTMPTKYSSTLHSRLSSLLRARHCTTASNLPRTPTISKPTIKVVSDPPQRLHPSPSPVDLRARAISTLTTLRNDDDSSIASEYISDVVRIQQDEDEEMVVSRDDFLSTWTPDSRSIDFEMEILEAAVDDIQRKVWIRSELRGLAGGVTKESVDMLAFDAEGLMTACVGSQRVVSRRQSAASD